MRKRFQDDREDKAGRRRAARMAWKEKARSHAASKGLPPKEAEKHVFTAHLQGVVSGVHRLGCTVLADPGEIECQWSHGILTEEVESPVVGDRVTIGLRAGAPALLTAIEPRRTRLSRMRLERADRGRAEAWEAPSGTEQVLAANVDQAVIVASAKAPAFTPRLVDRYIILCQFGGVEPIVCLNKIDLVEQPPDLSIYSAVGIPVIYASAATGTGLGELGSRLHGKTSVLTGHSGVGKSSILNSLLGAESLDVGEVSAFSQKGRHTTTASSLIELEKGTRLIDTPGIRSLSIWQIDEDSLRDYFPEFDDYSPDCKFNDCRHAVEPQCAVRAAAQSGKIPLARYESYLRLLEE